MRVTVLWVAFEEYIRTGNARAAARLPERLAKLHTAPMFDWNDLKYFLAFARAGSMQAAAKASRVNQSTVQRRISELESRIGQQLVVRHLAGYRLTRAGQELRRSAEKVEEAVTAFEHEVVARDKRLSGTIRVTTTGGVAECLRKALLIDAFHARRPDFRLELVVSDRILDLSAGEADLAIRSGEPRDKSLIRRKIADVPWAIYASRSYIEHHGVPRCVADIDHHVIVTCSCADQNDPVGQWLRLVAPHATVVARCETEAEQLRAVKSGAGIAPLLTHHEDADLIRVIDITDLMTPYYLLMHETMRSRPRVRAFADFVASEITAFQASISGVAVGGM
jgi:DNA-binding transcriptional LysR family regulator